MKNQLIIFLAILLAITSFSQARNHQNSDSSLIIIQERIGQVWIEPVQEGGVTNWILYAINTSGRDQEVTVTIQQQGDRPRRLVFPIVEASYNSPRNPKYLHSFQYPTKVIGESWGQPSIW